MSLKPISSSEQRKVPWSKALSVGPSSTYAPGPPSSKLLVKSPGQAQQDSFPKATGFSSEHSLTTIEKDDFEGWDPRQFDYSSSKFNSYTEGPGQLIQSREHKDVVSLFVDRIPTAITKEGLRNVFSGFGNVKRVAIIPPKLGWSTTYGFIEYGTVREAETAIQHLHNKDMGMGTRLIVKVSESKKDREEKLRTRQEEGEFFKNFHCSKNGIDNDDHNASDEEADKVLSNPLQPSYKPSVPTENGSRDHFVCNGNVGVTMNGRNSNSGSDDGSATAKLCVVCDKHTTLHCSSCMTSYCSRKCQQEDWSKHKLVCKSQKKVSHGSVNSKKAVASHTDSRKSSLLIDNSISSTSDNSSLHSSSSELQIAENPDDPGFVVDCPSEEEIVSLKDMLQDIQNVDDLSNILANNMNIYNRGSDSAIKMNSKAAGLRTPEGNREIENGGTQIQKTPRPSGTLGHAPSETTACTTPNFIGSNFESLPDGCFVSVKSIRSQFKIVGQPLLSVPLGSFPPAEFLAIVTFYKSPTQFTVVIPSVESKHAIQQIQDADASFEPGQLKTSQLSIGSKCGYRDKLGDFVRVAIDKIYSPQNILVHKYDFDGRLVVAVSELGYLPEELVLIPCLAHRCSLQHAFLSEEGKKNPQNFQALRDLVADQPILIHNHGPGLNPRIRFLICSIQSYKDGRDLNKELFNSPFVVTTDCAEEAHGPTAPKLKLSHPANKIPYHSVSVDSSIVVYPTVVVTPNIIWAQIIHPNHHVVEQMQRDINTEYSPRSRTSFEPYMPVVGEMCVAPQDQDRQFGRAEVLCVNHNGMVDVRFVETGYTGSVNASQLYHIDSVFLSLPKQARKLSLVGIAPLKSNSWSEDAVSFLKKKILHQKVDARVVSIVSDELLVDVDDPDLENQLLKNSLILLGYAQPKSTTQVASPAPVASLRGVSVSNKPRSSLQEPKSPCTLDSVPSSLPDTYGNQTVGITNSMGRKQTPQNRNVNPAKETSPKSGFSSPRDSNGVEQKGARKDQPFKTRHLSGNNRLSEGDEVKVSLSHVQSLERFYIQVMEPENLTVVHTMLDQIKQTKLVPLSYDQFRKDTFCLCLYPEDEQVHRARILYYNKERVSVMFVDYGNKFDSSSNHIYQIPDNLVNYPDQAISCSLREVRNPAGNNKPWTAAALSHFEKLLESGNSYVNVFKVVGLLHVVDVTVSTPKGKVDVLKAMCDAKYVDAKVLDQKSRSSTPNRKFLASNNDGPSSPNRKFGLTSDASSPNRKFGLGSDASSPNRKLGFGSDASSPNRKLGFGSDASSPNRKLGFGSDASSPNRKLGFGSDASSPNRRLGLGSSNNNTSSPNQRLDPEVKKAPASQGPPILCPLVSSLSKLPLPPSNKSFNILVCEVFTLQEIYIQIIAEEFVATNNKVTEVISSNFKADSLSTFPQKGSLCCAKYSQDGMWYRCEILGSTGDKTAVRFIDYGNMDNASLSDLAACPVQCASLPAVAVLCGWALPPSTSVQEDEVVEFLKEHTADCIVAAKIVGNSDGIPQLTMETKDLDFMKEMTKRGIFSPSAPHSLQPKVTELNRIHLDGKDGIVKAVITEVVSPSEIYLQIATDQVAKMLQSVSGGIADAFKSAKPQSLPHPSVTSLCCAKFSVDKQWYRGEIVEVKEEACVVFFVDFGNKDIVSLADITACPSSISPVPLLATRCSLSGLCPGNYSVAKVTLFLQELAEDMNLMVECVGDCDGIPLVQLKRSDGSDILTELTKHGFVGLPVTSVEDMETVLLPTSEAFGIMITEVVSHKEFYVQVATTEVGAMLSKITEGINDNSCPLQPLPSLPLPSLPQLGSLYCAKFSVDKQWYRVKIFQAEQQSCRVFFIDFGNTDSVPLSDIAVCPLEFSSLPKIAVKCALNGLPPRVSHSDKVTEHVQQHYSNCLLSAKVANKSEHEYLLDIYSEGKSAVDEMTGLGLIVQPVPEIVLPLVKDLKTVPLPIAGAFQVMVTDVVSPKEFYVQLATTEVGVMLSQITDGINDESQPLTRLASLPEAEYLYCAKFSSDKQWYRVEVLQVENTNCDVFFVDFGNKETVSSSDMAICPLQFCSVPTLAIKCGLAGLSPEMTKSEKLTDHLRQSLSNCLVSAKTIDEANGYPLLQISKDGNIVLDELAGLCPLLPTISLPSVKDLEKISLPSSGTFQVMVTEIANPTKLFVQLATTEVGTLLSKITQQINDESRPLQPLSALPEVGSLCCAKFSVDGQWYRVEVIQVVEMKNCRVFFVDYGNSDTVSLSDVAVCPPELCSVPLIAILCSLSGFPHEAQPNLKATQFLQQQTADALVSAKVMGIVGGIPQLELHNSDRNLLEEISKQNLITIHLQVLPLVSDLKRRILPSGAFAAVVMEMISFDEIYIQIATQEVAVELSELSDGLIEHFGSNTTTSSLSFTPSVGSLCCAKFSQDSLWYRAEIQSIKNDQYSVFFVDFGNSDIVSYSSLAVCPAQFASLSAVAVRCRLGAVSPSSTKSVEESVSFVKNLITNNVVNVSVVHTNLGIFPQVELSIDGKSVMQAMTEHGIIDVSHPSADDLEVLHFPVTPEYVQVVVYDVVSLGEFFVHVDNKQMSSTRTSITKITETLFANDPPRPLTVPPSVGDLCLAKYAEDGSWYRVKVTAVRGTSCKVLYVDYRNTEVVQLSDMTSCPASLAKLPQLAIKCGLTEVAVEFIAPEEKVKQFKLLTSNNCVLSAKYLSELDGVPQIELVKDGTNLLAQIFPAPSLSFPLVASMKKIQFPSSSASFQVLVCDLTSTLDIYVQINNEKTAECLKVLTERLDRFCSTKSLSSFPPVGSLCCAKFTQDEKWYRARVDTIAGSSCKVHFIDYGNSEDVILENMAICPPDLVDLPMVAVKCGLSGVSSLNPTREAWPLSSVNILKELTFGQLLNAVVVGGSGQDDCELSIPSSGALISIKFRQMLQSSSSGGVSLRRCQVTELNSPGSLYIQYVEKDNANNLHLLNKLQEFYANPSGYKDFTPTVGSLCCSQFSGDLCWYRCRVTSVDNDIIGLFYIDFGTIESHPRKKVFRLDSTFTDMTPLAVHCSIGGIKTVHSTGWGKATEKLVSLFNDKFLFVLLVGEEGGLSSVNMFLDEDCQQSVADILIAAGLAESI